MARYGWMVLLMWCLPMLARAQDFGGVPETLLEHLRRGRTEQVVAIFREGMENPGEQKQNLQQLKGQLDALVANGGKLHDTDLVLRQDFGKRYSRLVYLASFERGPLRLELWMYRGRSERWVVHSLTFTMGNDVVPKLLEDARSPGFAGNGAGAG